MLTDNVLVHVRVCNFLWVYSLVFLTSYLVLYRVKTARYCKDSQKLTQCLICSTNVIKISCILSLRPIHTLPTSALELACIRANWSVHISTARGNEINLVCNNEYWYSSILRIIYYCKFTIKMWFTNHILIIPTRNSRNWQNSFVDNHKWELFRKNR